MAWDIDGRKGGGERACVAIARATSMVCESSLLAVSESPGQFIRDKVMVGTIPKLFGTFDNPFPSPRSFSRAIRLADVIHVHQMNTYLLDLAIAMKGKKQVLVVTDYGGGGKSLGRIFRFFHRVDAFTSYSSEMDHLSYPKFTNVFQLPIPIDIAPYQKRNSKHLDQGFSVGKQRILAVGRIVPHKGFEVAIEALTANDSLTIVGVIEDRAYFNWLLRRPTKGTVSFSHDVDDAQLVEAYSKADIFVSTSVSTDYRGHRHPKSELLSLVTVEAASHGIPIIASSVSPALQKEIMAEVIPGSIYQSGNVLELRACFEKWRGLTIRSLDGARYVQRMFADETVGPLYRNFYADLMKAR